MVWLLERVHRLEDCYSRLHDLQHPDLPEREGRRSRRTSRMMAITDEVWLMTEAFYYFAWRFRQVFRDAGFRNFDPVGVRKVRNQLIRRRRARSSAVHWRPISRSKVS